MPSIRDETLPFKDFLVSLHDTTHAQIISDKNARVKDSAHFEKMRTHLLSLYSMMDVPNSFRGESGQIFDCVPIEQQLGMRKIEGMAVTAAKPASGRVAENPVTNISSCPAGTIPMRRVTLEEISSHETLEHFLGKGRRPKSQHPRLSETLPQAGNTDPTEHKYAHAWQDVNNMGGSNFLTIGHPKCDSREMSLSQHWYAAGSGNDLQTCEVGWQVQSGVFGNVTPHLFVYWTADSYQKTGSYNLEGGHFIQVNHQFAFGEQMPTKDISIEVNKQNDNWIIFLDGVMLGYFPSKLYGNGMMTKMANSIDFGGETAGHNLKWPPMGTGDFPGAKAARQYDTWYFPHVNGSNQPGKAKAPNLTPNQADPNWYKIKMEDGAGFEYGGPGGSD